jgi:hypothetical protein
VSDGQAGGRAGGRGGGRPGGLTLGRVVFVATLVMAKPLAGQIPDTTVADSVAQDTTDATALLIKSDEDSKVHLRAFPRVGLERLLPGWSRIVLPRDSIEFINAETLGDVLAQASGVYLWRGGWLGRAELPNYQGRGSTSVEYVLDGVPVLPLGQDSLAMDPSLFPLSMIDRVELETVPGLLRVHIYLRNHDLLSPRTRVAVARGDFDQARYEALFEKRFRSGFGVAGAVEFRSTPTTARRFDNNNVWLQMDWVPKATFGAQLRYLGTTTDREADVGTGTPPDTLALAVKGGRSDVFGRVFWRNREDGLGRRLDLVVNRTAWSSDSLTESRWQGGVIASSRARTSSLSATAMYGSKFTTFDGRLLAGWSSTEWLSTSLEGAFQAHEGGRTSTWLLARAGLRLPLGADLTGSWRLGKVVSVPFVSSDSAQDLSDREAYLSWQRSWIGGRVGYSRLAAFRPAAYRQFAQIDSIGASGPTEWLNVEGRISPRQWLTISGWYNHPLGPTPQGTPPNHSLINAAIRSKFLRTFPSGIFDLKLGISVENWGTGVIGLDAQGGPIVLPGATFVRGLIQMQFSGFIIYYDRFNLTNSTLSYVPGFPIPQNATTFGVRWSFLN